MGVTGLLAALASCSATDSAPPPNILLVTVDTLRADVLGAYGASDARTPRIDQLAREGTLYERAITPMPLTRPAHFSIFTSRYPREHGVVNNALSLPEDATTLAERLREHGYRTGAFVGVHLLSTEAGAAQGFDAFGEVDAKTKYRSGDLVVDEALSWLAEQSSNAPIFLWVHLFDPHLPYEPPPRFIENVDPVLAESHPTLAWRDLRNLAEERGGDLPAEVLAYGRSLYRAEVAATDFEIGRLLDGFGELRNLDDTVVVFTADHGECFERGVYFEHADCLHRGALRIPLILRHPLTFAAGKRESTPVSSLDLAPSLLAAAGLPSEESFKGESLSGLSQRIDDRLILVQHPLYQPRTAKTRARRSEVVRSVAGDPVRAPLLDRERMGVVGPDWKYIRSGTETELFPENGEEGEPLGEVSPLVVADLDDQLDRLLTEHPLRILDPGLIHDELRETLEALGYIAPSQKAAP